MITDKTYNELTELTDNKSLSKNNLANIFKVVKIGKNSYFNLSKTINFLNTDDLTSNMYSAYQVSVNDTWTIISYKFYNTIELWWLICKFNNIKDPLKMPSAGTFIKIPSTDLKNTILATF